MPSQRYRLKLATWTVVREQDQPSPRVLKDPANKALLSQELANAADDDKEHFWVVLVNVRHRYLLHTEVAVGTQNAALVRPREVFGPALREGAATLLLIHNHPSGDPEPSQEDRGLTRQLVECGKLLGVEILDHLIVGNGTGRWVSLRERGDV